MPPLHLQSRLSRPDRNHHRLRASSTPCSQLPRQPAHTSYQRKRPGTVAMRNGREAWERKKPPTAQGVAAYAGAHVALLVKAKREPLSAGEPREHWSERGSVAAPLPPEFPRCPFHFCSSRQSYLCCRQYWAQKGSKMRKSRALRLAVSSPSRPCTRENTSLRHCCN